MDTSFYPFVYYIYLFGQCPCENENKMKITPWFTRHQAILGVYDFLLSDEYNLSYNKTCPVNGGWDFEGQKSASIHH